jgi:hypothetical protein
MNQLPSSHDVDIFRPNSLLDRGKTIVAIAGGVALFGSLNVIFKTAAAVDRGLEAVRALRHDQNLPTDTLQS